MIRSTLAAALLATFALPSFADDNLARFEGAVGVQPLRAGGLANDVFGVNPGGRPWLISGLSAVVKADGKVNVVGRGLIFGGGASVGTSGGVAVKAKLLCPTSATTATQHDSGTITMEPDGDFRIDDTLVPPPPASCTNGVLLITSAANAWFAAGIPK